jgi:glycosyltransferase involved in cell wall biosynthesis
MTRQSRAPRLRIALLGIRGIPANYGGFEAFAEQLSVRLAERGHDVTVYGRSNYIRITDRTYRGVKLVVLPNIMHKYLDTPIHTLLATVHAIFRRHDVFLYCNGANVLYTLIPRIFGRPVVLNVDGLEWKRAKWGAFGKTVYKMSEFLSTFIPDRVVTDAAEVQAYYLRKFHKRTLCITYGAPEERAETDEILKRYGLEKQGYILYVSRLEPENNAHLVIRAFEKVKTDRKLVIVGDSPFSLEYIRKLKSTSDPRIVFTGFVFGRGYQELQSHAYCYVQASEVGGTMPSLVDAMGYGNCILANDVPQHREVLANAGWFFRIKNVDDLAGSLNRLLAHPETVRAMRSLALKRVREKYSWEKVTTDYERTFNRLCGRRILS